MSVLPETTIAQLSKNAWLPNIPSFAIVTELGWAYDSQNRSIKVLFTSFAAGILRKGDIVYKVAEQKDFAAERMIS